MSKVSVIMPAYNAELYINQTLTLLMATQHEMEVIIVDDASTDSTPDIIRSFQRRHSNIRVHRNEHNMNAGVSRNIGMSLATGDYFYFLDADDLLHDGALDELCALMDNADCDIITFRYRLMNDKDNGLITGMLFVDEQIWDAVIGQVPGTYLDLRNSGRFLMTANFPWNKIMKADFCRRTKFRFSSARLHEDIYAHWHSYLHANRILVLNKAMLVHRIINAHEQHTNVTDSRRLDVFDVFREVEALMSSNIEYKETYYHWYLAFKYLLIIWIFKNIHKNYFQSFMSMVSLSYADFDDAEFHRLYPKMKDIAMRSMELKYAPYKLFELA